MRPPDLDRGPIKAWKIRPPDPPTEAAIRAWAVTGPFHPFWHWWMVSVVSLRDVEGTPPAHKQYPEAEYEFMIVSINPERGELDVEAIERGEDWGDDSVPKFLTPVDSCVQFHGINDLQAAELCDSAVDAIVLGPASPDSDYRRYWQTMVPLTASHYAAGLHEDPPE